MNKSTKLLLTALTISIFSTLIKTSSSETQPTKTEQVVSGALSMFNAGKNILSIPGNFVRSCAKKPLPHMQM